METKDNYNHDEVFGHLRDATLSAQEAADYLELDMAGLVALVSNGKLMPVSGEREDAHFTSKALRTYRNTVQA